MWFHDVGAGGGCWSEWGSSWGWSSNASCSGGTSSHRQTWAGPEELSGALMSRADVWIFQWMADTVSAQTQPRNLWWGLCHTPHIFNLCPLCDLRPPFSFVCTRGRRRLCWGMRRAGAVGRRDGDDVHILVPGLCPSSQLESRASALLPTRYLSWSHFPGPSLHPYFSLLRQPLPVPLYDSPPCWGTPSTFPA